MQSKHEIEKNELAEKSADSKEETKESGDKDAPKSKLVPIKVTYCPNCGLPPDFCELSGDFEKCKPWLKDNFPQYYPNIFGVEENKSDTPTTSTTEPPKEGEANKDPAKEPPKEGKKKVTIKEEKKITVVKTKRNKTKSLTTITGLDKFDIPIKEAAKKFGKKFACGASPLDESSIEIQGDIAMELIDYIVETFPHIKKSSFVFQDKSEKANKQ